ncbi:hypothetical protein QYE76_066481 [Lolium multiflorum]|uniref:GTD-binding domain-containing protein n=1 Tax=Lolium multiflorum TaxID=4521 RepID=A0AAD8W9T3_LOLMU|nr:hypothetical protein QYE76_066481 [Lolium multiflorum]
MATEPAGDACPHCGAGEELTAGPARVTLRKRDLPADAVARVGPGDEAAALRDSLAWHQTGMAGLQEELEAERGAAAEAASEAMSMILRLQRDKSEAMMEARQFRRFAEDRFAHDAAELAALHDAIARRDASIQSLSAQLRACRSRLLQLGFLSPSSLPSSPTAAAPGDHPFADDDYPSIHCLDQPAAPSDVGTPRTHHLLNRLPGRPADTCARPRHARALSNDSLFALPDESPFLVEQDDDDCCDRVYTVDAVHAAPEDRRYFPTPMETNLGSLVPAWTEEQEIHKLSARLQALEADRESMRHAIMSMGPHKAQALMLNDIAHHLCDDDEAPLNALSFKMHPDRKVVKSQPFAAKFFLVTVIKWIASVFSRGRKLDRIKYPIGLCGSYVGLMLLLDRSHKQRYRRYLKRS